MSKWLAFLLAASHASHASALQRPDAVRRIALRGGAREQQQQLRPRGGWGKSSPLPPARFLVMAAVALVDTLLNVVRPERVTGIYFIFRQPRLLWNVAMVWLCLLAQYAEPAPSIVLLIAWMAALTGLSDLVVWCPLMWMSVPDKWESCKGQALGEVASGLDFLFWVINPRTCTPLDRIERYWWIEVVVVESLLSGVFWLWAAIHAKRRISYLRDEQKDARAGVVALTLCWTVVILYDLLDSSAEQSLLVWLWFVVLPALASVFAIF